MHAYIAINIIQRGLMKNLKSDSKTLLPFQTMMSINLLCC